MKSIRCRLHCATWCEYFKSGECTSQEKCEYQTEHMSVAFPEAIFLSTKEAWEKMQAENSRLVAENAELRERLEKAEHRAEVAERQAVILSQWLAEKTRKDYLWQVWLDAAQKQAEKELVAERQMQRYITCLNSGMDERIAAGAFDD